MSGTITFAASTRPPSAAALAQQLSWPQASLKEAQRIAPKALALMAPKQRCFGTGRKQFGSWQTPSESF